MTFSSARAPDPTPAPNPDYADLFLHGSMPASDAVVLQMGIFMDNWMEQSKANHARMDHLEAVMIARQHQLVMAPRGAPAPVVYSGVPRDSSSSDEGGHVSSYAPVATGAPVACFDTADEEEDGPPEDDLRSRDVDHHTTPTSSLTTTTLTITTRSPLLTLGHLTATPTKIDTLMGVTVPIPTKVPAWLRRCLSLPRSMLTRSCNPPQYALPQPIRHHCARGWR